MTEPAVETRDAKTIEIYPPREKTAGRELVSNYIGDWRAAALLGIAGEQDLGYLMRWEV